ncbi:hypothetical protein DB346_19480 [Verrucomicrobia bacterium LW23]|nr:hypothetical protein DB346_19480 [Verrucomicrobia bacterium LW23]
MRNIFHSSVFLLAIALTSTDLRAQGDITLPLVNGSFEDGTTGWTIHAPEGTTAAESMPDAASLGRKGLRITNPAAGNGFEVISGPLPVNPGKTYSVSFWSGGGGRKPGVASAKMVFTRPKAAGGVEILQPAMASIRKWPGAEISGGLYFGNVIMAAAAPEGATELRIHIIPKRGAEVESSVDIDDFIVKELADVAPQAPRDPKLGNPVPPTDPAQLEAWLTEIRNDPWRGKKPPRIVLKLDDFKAVKGGGIHQRWLRVADYAAQKQIKLSFGIIGNGMETDANAFYTWVKEKHAAGQIEFWHHGYDHAGDGKIMEFSGQPFEHQREHMARTQQIAKDKLGFAFTSFGAPFNATDAATLRVLQDEPDLKVWMYGNARTPAGKIVLQRAFNVNLESPTIIANYGAFIQGYAHNRGAEYFVLQGHPAGWGDDRYAEFQKIIEFLLEQKAQFVLPRDFIANPPAPVILPAEAGSVKKESVAD